MIMRNFFWQLFILMYIYGQHITNGQYVDTCYAADACGTDTITCAAGTLIAPQLNYLFRKADRTPCPGPAADCSNVCCSFEEADANIESNYELPETTQTLGYVVTCLKQESCVVPSSFNNAKDFDYVYYPYACMNASKIVDMVDNVASVTFNGDASVFYSAATEATPGTICSCEFSSVSQMNIASIYVYLDQTTCPKVTLTVDNGANIVNCAASEYLLLEEPYDAGNVFNVTLNGLNASEFNVLWIKFETDPAVDINVQCKGCSRSTTTSTNALPQYASSCYTNSGTCLTADISCPPGNVIVPSLYFLVKKETSNSCPPPDGDCGNICCTFEEDDFTDTNNFEYADIEETLDYITECMNKESCAVQTTFNANTSYDYHAFSYYCKPVTSVVNMVDNIGATTFNGEVSIYYSAAEEATPGNNCSCVVTSDTSMKIQSYYVLLDSTTCPKVITTVAGTELFTCNNDGYFSFDTELGTRNKVYIELQNLNSAADNEIWFGISTDPAADMSVSCFGCSRSTTNSPTTTVQETTQATTQETTQTTKQATTQATTQETTQETTQATTQETAQTTTQATTTATTQGTTQATTQETTTATTQATTQATTTATTVSTTSTSTAVTADTPTTTSTNVDPNSSTDTSVSNTTTNGTSTDTSNLPTNLGVDAEKDETASSTVLIIAISATFGVLILGVTITHGVLYLIHKNKNAKIAP